MRFRNNLSLFLSLGHTRVTHQNSGRTGHTLTKLLRASAVLSVAALTGLCGLQAQTCPAFGADTDCGTIITITDSPTGLIGTLTSTGQGPYDGNDDTLVGVVNLSSKGISTISLSSIHDIFGFDGDGIQLYGAATNPLDTSGVAYGGGAYGGPNAYYQNIGNGNTRGDVYFINPIPAYTGTAYFSLENALTAANFRITGLNSGGGTIYVADNRRVQSFTSSGVFKNQFGILGPNNRFLFGAGRIAADSAGNV